MSEDRVRYEEPWEATSREYIPILIPTEPYPKLKISERISEGKKKKLFKGETLYKTTRSIDDPYYYYIDEGQIAMTMLRESGGFTPMFWRNAGNAFPIEYHDFASVGKYQAGFFATKNTVLYSFTQRQLHQFAVEDPELFYEFIYVCHIQFAQNGHRSCNAALQTPPTRIFMWLQKLCCVSEPNADGSYDIPCTMTLKQLAELFMIHITTCTKTFSAFEKQGLVKRHRTRIHVYDIDALGNFVLEDDVSNKSEG